MEAIQFSRFGGSDVLELKKDIPIPVPDKDQVLVRNAYSGVNFIDVYHRTGLYSVSLPFVPGGEASGVIDAVGSEVKGLKVGDRVMYIGQKTYAQYTAVDAAYVILLPDHLSLEEGSAVMLQGLTAAMLTRIIYEIKPNDFVLVHAAAGGTGRLVVQVAKHFGATVIGTTSTPEKAELARQAGADHVILYTKESVPEAVKRITNGKGVNVVYDGVGKSTLNASLESLAFLGSMVSFGNASGKIETIDPMWLTPKLLKFSRPSIISFIKDKDRFQYVANILLELVNTRKLKFKIYKVYNLEEAGKAQDDIESRKTDGKLIIKC